MQITLWTIGHSTRTIEEFLALLEEYRIASLVDVRSYPGSRRLPHFNQDQLRAALTARGLEYRHMPDLGGRRKPSPDSKNTVWRNAGFQGYADYMETEPFKAAMQTLGELASTRRTAIMCAEAVWWRCHRSMISDYAKSIGWTVLHILGPGKTQEHPYTSAASIEQGKLSYRGPQGDLFDESGTTGN